MLNTIWHWHWHILIVIAIITIIDAAIAILKRSGVLFYTPMTPTAPG
jgi:hypothetical protein